MQGRVLIVDDERSVCDLLESGLKKRGFEVETRTSADAALALVAEEEFDAVVTDIRMKGMDGLALCERIAANRPDVPVLVITAFGSLEAAIAAIRAGAYDFLTKPFELEVLRLALERAIRHKALREEVKRLRKEAAASQGHGEMLGASAPMRKVYDLIDRVAEVDTSVLITGESGTGKELVARALHGRSQRREGPFIAVNCAAVPEPLLESELFGHARGAFTDAKGARLGLFFQANGGTLFLDEIGDMPLGLQPKLLRALQERRARPLGADEERPFDVRVIAATNSDIEAAVEERRFREDLYYRINVVHVELPPLRSRGSDVLLMAQHFVERFATVTGRNVTGLSAAAAERLVAYSWPGNVRELSNCMERAVALARYEQIAVEDLPQKIQRYQTRDVVPVTEDPAELLPMDEVERRYIARVLEAVQGNKTLAAKVLGFDRATLYRKLARYGETPPTGSPPSG
ncbi:sigma-54-dependent transcriptional regulator [Chondromyces apiculatus]|uniref:Response regulator of zinc sigma-54-dependent two-component system n=1 Tax=Chondromyces apiculatus DSM 436 TaxID=1192034 RepID=A0A017T6X0_9BACT|nr:sigma-54 dependent transcriptional regulator [Chondromyces apiculatus]EYF04969.1 Response regulator of zinc sigma-54-dependent two-component system [Chondromyces apiculatus DSM 436]